MGEEGGDSFAPRGYLVRSIDYLVFTWREGAAGIRGQRPGLLLNTLQAWRRPTTQNPPGQKVLR